MGRPKLDIDEEQVARLAFDGASNREIGDIIGCDHKTVANRFSPLLRKSRAQRRLRLRQAQFETAMGGTPAMLIWLGKQELDQQETPTPTPDQDTAGDGVAILESLLDRLAARLRADPGDPGTRPEGGD